MASRSTTPKSRLSLERFLWSPSTKYSSSGTVNSLIERSSRNCAEHVGLLQATAVHQHLPPENLDPVARNAHHSLDVVLAGVARIPEHHHVAALDAPQTVGVFVDEDTLLIGQSRHHAGALYLYRLVQEHDDEE